MAKAFKAWIGNLLFELLTHTLCFLGALHAARTIPAGAFKPFANGLHDFLIGIEFDLHINHLFLCCVFMIPHKSPDFCNKVTFHKKKFQTAQEKPPPYSRHESSENSNFILLAFFFHGGIANDHCPHIGTGFGDHQHTDHRGHVSPMRRMLKPAALQYKTGQKQQCVSFYFLGVPHFGERCSLCAI